MEIILTKGKYLHADLEILNYIVWIYRYLYLAYPKSRTPITSACPSDSDEMVMVVIWTWTVCLYHLPLAHYLTELRWVSHKWSETDIDSKMETDLLLPGINIEYNSKALLLLAVQIGLIPIIRFYCTIFLVSQLYLNTYTTKEP
jgi:hypothetical protein